MPANFRMRFNLAFKGLKQYSGKILYNNRNLHKVDCSNQACSKLHMARGEKCEILLWMRATWNSKQDLQTAEWLTLWRLTTTKVVVPHLLKVAFYIFIQQIQVMNILTKVYTHSFFSSSKCSLFHNSNVFGSCIIHIFYTGCAKIKIYIYIYIYIYNSGAKRLHTLRFFLFKMQFVS